MKLLQNRLVVESKLQFNMLKRLRFKYATKILLHELNVHAEMILELAKAFDKADVDTKISMIVEAIKNMDPHERN